jgi:hypothetical protein
MRKESKGRVCSFEAPFAFSDVIRAAAYEQNRAGSTASTTYLSYLIEREHLLTTLLLPTYMHGSANCWR